MLSKNDKDKELIGSKSKTKQHDLMIQQKMYSKQDTKLYKVIKMFIVQLVH